MRTILPFTAFGSLILGIVSIDRHFEPNAAAGPSRSLELAVDAFNVRSAAHLARHDQQPLSKKEVIDAIEAWQRHGDLAISSDATGQIAQIANTGVMPVTARFYKSFVFEPDTNSEPSICAIYLEVLDKRGNPYVFPIRRYPRLSETLAAPFSPRTSADPIPHESQRQHSP